MALDSARSVTEFRAELVGRYSRAALAVKRLIAGPVRANRDRALISPTPYPTGLLMNA